MQNSTNVDVTALQHQLKKTQKLVRALNSNDKKLGKGFSSKKFSRSIPLDENKKLTQETIDDGWSTLIALAILLIGAFAFGGVMYVVNTGSGFSNLPPKQQATQPIQEKKQMPPPQVAISKPLDKEKLFEIISKH